MYEYQAELKSFHLLIMSMGVLVIFGLLWALAIGKKKGTL